jgi:hypothetical protein
MHVLLFERVLNDKVLMIDIHSGLKHVMQSAILERRYRRSGSTSDKTEFIRAHAAARQLINSSRADTLKSQVAGSAGDAKKLWQTTRKLLHSTPPSAMTDEDCAQLSTSFCQFFCDKIVRIQKTIADEFGSLSISRSRTPTREYVGPRFETLQRVSTTDVVKLVGKMPNKSSPRDFLPTSLLRSCIDIFALVIAHLANLSFASGQFPSIYRTAQVLPLLKKQGLDQSNLVNYRPISNLSTISKIIERLALSQLRPHLLALKNFNPLQSGYRPAYSTETALLRNLDSCYSAMDNKRQTALISLDILAAFDTINHRVLLVLWREPYSSDFGVDGTALDWLRSYLVD